MRPPRFKAISKGEWVYGTYCIDELGHCIYDDDRVAHEIDPDTLCQDTSLTFHDEPIYDGDIFYLSKQKFTNKKNNVYLYVKYNKWRYVLVYYGTEFKDTIFGPITQLYGNAMYGLKLVGNIHYKKLNKYKND